MTLLPPPLLQCRGMGNGGCSQSITLCLCHSFLLTLIPSSSVGSLPQDTVLHELLQHGSVSLAEVLQERTAPPWVLQRLQFLSEKLLPRGLLPIPDRLSMGSSFFQGTPLCSSVGSSPGSRWISAPLWTSMVYKGTVCLTMVFSMGCRGISAPAPVAPPAPLSSLTLVSAGLFLEHFLTPLSQLLHNIFTLS